ncbi:MAG: hypothetical protein JSU91_01280 [Thermoplasmatales archaeon]|nr:MAG: hypothetical protein JSU91_01280 [Thermoplasmatales archaeon]
MKRIWIVFILALLMLIPATSAVDIRSDLEDDNVEIYKFARIKTTERTGGFALCFPGYLRSIYLWRIILFHSYVVYEDNYWEGWYLTINGDKVSRGSGYIFGFSGIITNWWGGLGTKPDYNAFELDGVALRVIHISD